MRRFVQSLMFARLAPRMDGKLCKQVAIECCQRSLVHVHAQTGEADALDRPRISWLSPLGSLMTVGELEECKSAGRWQGHESEGTCSLTSDLCCSAGSCPRPAPLQSFPPGDDPPSRSNSCCSHPHRISLSLPPRMSSLPGPLSRHGGRPRDVDLVRRQ